MTPLTPVDQVAQLLQNNGYRSLPTPLEVAGLKFEMQAAFLGTSPSPDLILVADTAFDDEKRILKAVEGMARTLDVLKSKRPMSLILVGPRPQRTTIEAMSRVCRVLPVPLSNDEDTDASLANWLAVLLPLRLPEPDSDIADPIKELTDRLTGIDPDIKSLVQEASQGASQVRSRFYNIIEDELKDIESDD